MPRGGTQYRLIGQAGVYAAASQLMLAGHNVLFPSVDNGYDLLIENGLRIQVKAASLIFQSSPMYKEGVYAFDLRRSCYDPNTANHQSTQKYRTYTDVADFFVLWGIDEGRFWIIPTSIKNKKIFFPRRNSIARTNSHSTPYWTKKSFEKEASMENRWDLLEISETLNIIEVASSVTELAQEKN
jgi:hypothetical protein